MADFTVIKQNHLGEEIYRWNARVLERNETQVSLEALFALSGQGKSVPENGILLGEVRLFIGDVFLETYFVNRWHNIFEIHDRNDGQIKCWYCNIAYPAVIESTQLSFRDLALDLLVYPDGRQLVLDRDEFEALQLSPDLHAKVLASMQGLQKQFTNQFNITRQP